MAPLDDLTQPGSAVLMGGGGLIIRHLSVQGPVPDQGDRCGPAVLGEQSSGPHPEPNRVLPDEHPRAAPHHLPVSARRERAQPAGEDWRGLRPVQQGQEGRRGAGGKAGD